MIELVTGMVEWVVILINLHLLCYIVSIHILQCFHLAATASYIYIAMAT